MERCPIPVVGTIVHDKENRVLLVKRKNKPYKGYWAIPGGKVKYGERLEDAVKIEIYEETGPRVKVEKYLKTMDGIAEKHHFILSIS